MHTADSGAYALVGMGTAFAGIVRTPLTSVIMIFEMTRDYSIIVPLMISNLIAFFISQQLQREPIYEALAHQDGIHLPTGTMRVAGGRLLVSSAMRPLPAQPGPDDVEALQALIAHAPHLHLDHTLHVALARMGESGLDLLPVVSREDLRHVIGTVALRDVLATYGVEPPTA